MLSLLKRKPKPPVEAEPVEPDRTSEAEPAEAVRRNRQQNIKARGGLLRRLRGACGSARHEQGRVVRGHGRRALGDAAAARVRTQNSER